MAQQQEHPIFRDINRSDLEAVQAHVLTDPTMVDERDWEQRTPLIYAIDMDKPAIALWLIEHRGLHNLEARERYGLTALYWASSRGLLSVVQVLVGAGADPAAMCGTFRWSPLMVAAKNNHTNIIAFLLQLPAVKASIDHHTTIRTVLSIASCYGHQPAVQLLLDAGADPTIPAGQWSPLNQALRNHNHHAIAALLRHAIAEPERAKTLHKARALLDPAAPPHCLKGRVEQAEALPLVELNTNHEDEQLRATAAFALGLEGGEEDEGLLPELYVELLGYMLPAWADKGE